MIEILQVSKFDTYTIKVSSKFNSTLIVSGSYGRGEPGTAFPFSTFNVEEVYFRYENGSLLEVTKNHLIFDEVYKMDFVTMIDDYYEEAEDNDWDDGNLGYW